MFLYHLPIDKECIYIYIYIDIGLGFNCGIQFSINWGGTFCSSNNKNDFESWFSSLIILLVDVNLSNFEY
jgi:hypothetical protein